MPPNAPSAPSFPPAGPPSPPSPASALSSDHRPTEQPARRTSVLLVDDDVNVLVAMTRLLGERHELRAARSGRDALRLAHLDPPDLVLLDLQMPDMDGYQVCHALQADPLLQHTVVVFLSSQDDAATELRGLEAGAMDFISKPPRGPAVAARIDNLIALKQMSDRLRAAALTDGLTGLANRHRFDEALQTEWLRAMRTGRPLALLMADVDHFKAYNDHHGHPAGDACLKHVALALQATLHRPGDLAARYGGEEFVLLLPDTDGPGAENIAQRAVQAVAEAGLPHGGLPQAPQVSISVGVSLVDPTAGGWHPWPEGAEHVAFNPQHQPGQLVEAADQALYAAKHHGRGVAWFLALTDLNRDGAARPCHAPKLPGAHGGGAG